MWPSLTSRGWGEASQDGNSPFMHRCSRKGYSQWICLDSPYPHTASVNPAFLSLPEATNPHHSLPHGNHSACMNDTSRHAPPLIPSVTTDKTIDAKANTPSNSKAYSPIHLVLTTFDEHHDSEPRTSLAASINRLLNGGECLLKEFDKLRSTL